SRSGRSGQILEVDGGEGRRVLRDELLVAEPRRADDGVGVARSELGRRSAVHRVPGRGWDAEIRVVAVGEVAGEIAIVLAGRRSGGPVRNERRGGEEGFGEHGR